MTEAYGRNKIPEHTQRAVLNASYLFQLIIREIIDIKFRVPRNTNSDVGEVFGVLDETADILVQSFCGYECSGWGSCESSLYSHAKFLGRKPIECVRGECDGTWKTT